MVHHNHQKRVIYLLAAKQFIAVNGSKFVILYTSNVNNLFPHFVYCILDLKRVEISLKQLPRKFLNIQYHLRNQMCLIFVFRGPNTLVLQIGTWVNMKYLIAVVLSHFEAECYRITGF